MTRAKKTSRSLTKAETESAGVALAASGFPGSVLEPFLKELTQFTESGVENAITAFRDYLNDDENKTIRLFVADAEGIVQQASTVLVLRRLTGSSTTDTPAGYDYAGTIEVAYAGGSTTLKKLQSLLPELEGETEGKVKDATVKLLALPLEDPDEVNLGLTGGAPEDQDFLADLKVKFFLRLQPYRQEGQEQVIVGGDDARTIDLNEQESLGEEKFALRAYSMPDPELSDTEWEYYTHGEVSEDVKRNANIVKWLTENPQIEEYDLQPIDGINGGRNENLDLVDSEMGSPASERVFEVVVGTLASQLEPGGGTAPGAKTAILFNFAEYDPDEAKILSFGYINSLLRGGPTDSEVPFLPESLGGNAEGNGVGEVVRAYESRKDYLQNYLLEGEQEDLQRDQQKALTCVTFLNKPTLDDVQNALHDFKKAAKETNRESVLYLQLGPVPRPIYDVAYAHIYKKEGEKPDRRNGLPSVFTGLGTANLALTLGNYYYSVASPREGGIQYPETVLTKNNNGEVPFEMQTVADQVGVSLSDWPAQVDENPAEVQGNFVKTWRSEVDTDKFKSYFSRVRTFYLQADNDKLNLGLAFFNYVIETEGITDNPLVALYKDLQENIKENELDLVPGVFTDETVIGKFFAELLAELTGGKLILENPEAKAEPDAENPEEIFLSGTTNAFGVETGVDIVYTAPEKRTVSQNKFTAKQSWSIPGVEWIVFSDPFIRADVVDRPPETEPQPRLPTVGAVGGTVSGSEEDTKFTFQFDAPVEEGKWLLQGWFEDPLKGPPSISSFYQLAGGINIAASLPPPLNVLTGLGLSNFELLYDEENSKAEYLNFVIETSQPLRLLPGVDLQDLGLEFNIQNPQDVKTRSWTTTADANFHFKQPNGVQEDAVVGVSVKVPAMVFNGQLDSGTITVASLIETFVPLLKGSLDFLPNVSITAFSFNYQKEKDALDVSAEFNTNFEVIPGILAIDQLSFEISRRTVENEALNTGSIAGSTTILPDQKDGEEDLSFTVAVSADYDDQQKSWTFNAFTTSDVRLGKMIEYYLEWKLGDFGDTLAIEKLALQVEVEGETKSWEFSGSTTPFDTPMGLFVLQASATIGDNKGSKSLGLGVIDASAWGCDPPPVQSRFLPEFFPTVESAEGKYGTVGGSVTWENITFRIAYNFNEDPEKNQFCIGWEIVL